MFTDEQIETIIQKRSHYPVKENVKQAKRIEVHAEGEYPAELIEGRRPFELDFIRDYRKEIYRSKTKGTINKVISSLEKIRRSPEWGATYPTMPPKIKKGETLEDYLETGIGGFYSLTNFIFNYYLKSYLIDANMGVLWKVDYTAETEYLKPYPEVYDSDDILWHSEGHLVLEEEDDTYTYWTNEMITKYQVNGHRKLIKTYEMENPFGFIPFVKAKSRIKEIENGFVVNESRIDPMVEDLDEAAREYSDQQASVVNYLYPERWEYASEPCSECKDLVTGISTGIISIEGKAPTQCRSCNGTGKTGQTGPYRKFVVQPPSKLEGESVITPPFGYVSKDSSIIEIVDKRIANHLYSALASINMQFLDQTPLNISGEAKSIDKDELNNFVYSIAEDLVYFYDASAYVIAAIRYQSILPDFQAYLPIVRVPERYDLLNENFILDDLVKAKEKKLSPILIAEMEKNFYKKRYYGDADKVKYLEASIDLNPLFGVSEEDKMVMKNNGGVVEIDYVISSNINKLLSQAIENDAAFLLKTKSEQKDVIKGLAEELIGIAKPYLPAEGEVDVTDIQVTPESAKLQAESQAALRGSVGGVTGIIQLQQSVSAGTTTKEAAIAILEYVYGYNRSEAQQIIGNPQ